MTAPMILHVYGPAVWHDPVIIAGTREALHALAETIQCALAGPRDSRQAPPDFCATDGEGFRVEICVATLAGMDDYALPYTDAVAQQRDAVTSLSWPLKEPRDA